jgi:arylsulfatase A-like enzyme
MKKPNILFILTDDQGAWALGCAGNREIHTPTLDRLAAQGIRFENFFCASPVCSPARASILTGRIPSQHGIHDWLYKGNLARAESKVRGDAGDGVNRMGDAFAVDDRSIEYLAGMRGYSDYMAESGYTCAMVGKWHLGASLKPQKGFSFWRVIPYGGSDYNESTWIVDGELRREKGYLTDRITAHALDFLETRRGQDAPFYLSVHYTAPHSPWERGQHPAELTGLYADCPFETCPREPELHPWQINSAPRGRGERRRELLAGYYAAISGVDRGVESLLAKLDALGLRENTLVIFSGDNGMNMGHHGVWGKGNGTFPMNMYDTSVKVPFLISWPGHLPAGLVDNHLLSHYDLFPTLLDYLDIPNREENLPGASFAPLLRGAEIPGHEVVIVYDEYGPVRMVRTRDWKYVHRYPYGPHELYDLQSDPGEERNLANDPAHADRVTDMKARLEEWFLHFTDPRVEGIREAVTGKGQIDWAGVLGQGRPAYDSAWYYIDADGKRRSGT